MNQRLATCDESPRPQAESLWTSLWSCVFTAALFAAVSFVSSPVPGVNEPHYLTKARSFDDPSWCSRDFFLKSANAHYSFYWLTGGFTRSCSLASVAVAGRILSSVLLAGGWNILGRALGLTGMARIIAAGVFATLSLLGNFSGEWLLGGFESKVPSWGLALMSAGFWIQGQQRTCPGVMTLAGLFCGLACALHPVVGGWAAVCVFLASVMTLRWKTSRVFKAALGLGCFSITTIVGALPGLVPALGLVLDRSLPQKDRDLATFYQVFWRLKHHLDPTELLASQWGYAAAVSLGILLSCLILYRFSENSRIATDAYVRPGFRSDPAAYLLVFFLMSALIALAGIQIGWHTEVAQKMHGWQWRAALLKFYPFRCFDAMLPITLAFLLTRIAQDSFHRLKEPSPKLTIEAPWKAGRRLQLIVITLMLIAAFLVPIVPAGRIREVSPAGYSPGQLADWRAACEWIRTNTPEDSLFLTPRESFAFKWFAERAEFVCYKDCPQDPAGILTWNKRLWMIHDWTLQSSSDQRYDQTDLQILRRLTECDFIITRTLGPFEATPVWEGKHWKIFRVP